jgi:hypothetical protein
MANDVRHEIKNVIMHQGGKTAEEAEEYLAKMAKEGRYAAGNNENKLRFVQFLPSLSHTFFSFFFSQTHQQIRGKRTRNSRRRFLYYQP